MDQRQITSVSRTAGLLLVALAWALFLASTGSPEAILFTLPVFLIAAPLALGRYVGEGIVESLRVRPRRRLSRNPARVIVARVTAFNRNSFCDSVPGRGPPATCN